MSTKLFIYSMISASLVTGSVLAGDVKPIAPGDAAPMMVVDTKSFVTTATSSNEFESSRARWLSGPPKIPA